MYFSGRQFVALSNGAYPVGDGFYNISERGQYLERQDDGSDVVTWFTRDQVEEHFSHMFRSAYLTQASSWNLANTTDHKGASGLGTMYPMIVNKWGTPVTVPPPSVHEFPLIKRNNQPAYAESKHNDKIIVSDYQKGSVTVTHRPGYKISSKSWFRYGFVTLFSLLGLDPNPGPSGHQIGGFRVVTSPVFQIDRFDVVVYEIEGKWFVDAEQVYNSIAPQLTPIGDLITETVAEANRGALNVLTALAESPETLKGILRGCITLVRLFNDAKKKELRLMNKLKNLKPPLNSSKEERDAIRHLNAVRNYKKAVNDITRGIADVWLNFRLNMTPTAKAIEATIDGLVLGYANREFVRTRGATPFELEFDDLRFNGVARCMVKRVISPDRTSSAYFTSNPLETAYELIPLSFVLDRYVAIGDWIVSNFSRPQSYTTDEGSTFSWEMDDSLVYHDSIIRIDFYKRRVINANGYCPLYFPPDRTMYQTLDHIALLWNSITKTTNHRR